MHLASKILVGALITAAVASFAIPAWLVSLGFTTTGLSAGSWASRCTATYGGEKGLDYICTTFRSIGAVGLSTVGIVSFGALGGALVALGEL